MNPASVVRRLFYLLVAADGFLGLLLIAWTILGGMALRMVRDHLHIHTGSTLLACGSVLILFASTMRASVRRY